MTVHETEVPVPEGRLDSITSRLGKGLRSLESKTMTMWKKGGYYLTEQGEMIVEHVDASLQRMVDQSRKHVEGMRALKAANPERAIPASENILVTVRAPKAIVDQVRLRAQALAARMEGPRIGIGVIGESALSRLGSTASRVAGKVAGGVKSIGPSLAVGFLAGQLEADYEREFSIRTGGAPTSDEAAFMQSRGFSYDETAHEWTSHMSLGQKVERILNGLTVWIGDPVWVSKIAQPPRWDPNSA
jgi:hypothetical protein